jgi:hypothetical protein
MARALRLLVVSAVLVCVHPLSRVRTSSSRDGFLSLEDDGDGGEDDDMEPLTFSTAPPPPPPPPEPDPEPELEMKQPQQQWHASPEDALARAQAQMQQPEGTAQQPAQAAETPDTPAEGPAGFHTNVKGGVIVTKQGGGDSGEAEFGDGWAPAIYFKPDPLQSVELAIQSPANNSEANAFSSVAIDIAVKLNHVSW